MSKRKMRRIQQLPVALVVLLVATPAGALTTMMFRAVTPSYQSLLYDPLNGYACMTGTNLKFYYNGELGLVKTTAGTGSLFLAAAPTSDAPPCIISDSSTVPTKWGVFFSAPISADVTLASNRNLTGEISCQEDYAVLNASLQIRLEQWRAGRKIAAIATVPRGNECPTTAATGNLKSTAEPDLTLKAGDRIAAFVEVNNCSVSNGQCPNNLNWGGDSSHYVTFRYDGAATGTYYSHIDFYETINFSADSQDRPNARVWGD